LLEYSKTIPNPHENQINLDIQRTFPDEKLCMEKSFLAKLKNILLCYAIRNSSIGYCQGMNFIVCRLLLIMDNEEQVFWIFIQIIEKILPIIYYSDLAGIIIETTIIDTFISFYLKNLYNYLVENSFKLSLNNFIHKWMVSLFTQALSPEMAYTFLDYFFLDGEICLFKCSLFVMTMIEEYLTKNNDFEYLFNMFTEAPSHIHDPKTLIYFLYEKVYEINEIDIKIYKEKLKIPVLNKLKEEIRESFYKQCEQRKKSLKMKKINCNPNWPTCLYDNYNHIVVEYVIMKENKSPFLINDYYYIKNEGNKKGFDKFDELRHSLNKDILIERQKHVCDDMKLVNTSQNLIENLTNRNKKLDIDNLFEENKNNDNTIIYGHLGESKDFDKLIQEIKNDLILKEKEIDMNEMKLLIEKNSEGEKYYHRDYSFYVPE
jgi:hypothetical protein